jgi:hypothetical protein
MCKLGNRRPWRLLIAPYRDRICASFAVEPIQTHSASSREVNYENFQNRENNCHWRDCFNCVEFSDGRNEVRGGCRCGSRSGRGPSCQRNGGPRRRGRCRAVQKTGVPSRCRRTSFAWLPTRDLCQGMPEGAVAFSICHRDMYWTVEAERSSLFRASAFTFDSMFAVAALIGLTAVLLPNMVFAARRLLAEQWRLDASEPTPKRPGLRRRVAEASARHSAQHGFSLAPRLAALPHRMRERTRPQYRSRRSCR